MLTVIPRSWISWDFRVVDDGEELALIDRNWFRESASFSIEGRRFDVRRTSVVRGTFVLETAGVVLAEAVKPSAFRRAFEIRCRFSKFRDTLSGFFSKPFPTFG